MSSALSRRAPFVLALLAAAAPAQTFVERTSEVGLAHEHASGFDRVGELPWGFDWAQSGIALGDIDGDDDLDIVATGGPLPLHVYRYDAGVFTDVTAASGVVVGGIARTPALGDIDNDGDLDLFIGTVVRGDGPTLGESHLFVNDGSGVFTDITEVAGTFGAGHTIHAKWADLNRDGLTDLWAGEFHGTPNLWYRNNGDLSFTEMGAAMDLDVTGSAHVVGVADTDNDGNLDGFVGNDWSVTRLADLAQNDGDHHIQGLPDGTMVDVTGGSGYFVEAGIMGLTFGDFNYDGKLDVYKTDAGANDLLVNFGWPGSGTPWIDVADAFGVLVDQVPNPENPGAFGVAISWGAAFFNADLDPWLDLFVANGIVLGGFESINFHSRYQQDYFFRGLGQAGGYQFSEETVEYGLFNQIDSRGIALGDVDDDGDLDLFISSTVGALRYYENQLDRAGQGWLKVLPNPLTSNRDGMGTRVSWTDSLGLPHLLDVGADAPTASQHPNEAHFGLGLEASVDVSVRFRSGITKTIAGVLPDTELTVSEPQLFAFSTRTLPITSEAGTGDPTEVVVDVFAHGSTGNPLGAGAAVSIEIPGLVATNPVTNVSGNQFTRTFAAPATAGAYPVQVSFNTFVVPLHPLIHAYGPFDAGASSVRVLPHAVRARTQDTFTVRYAPKDANGISLGAGLAVAFAPVGGVRPLSGTVDLGNGIYEATYAAPQTPGIYPIDVTVDGAPVPAVATIDVGGTPAAASVAGAGIPGGPLLASGTTLYLAPPDIEHSCGPHQYKLLVTPRDLAGRRLGSKARVTIEVVEDPGSAPTTLRRLTPLANGDHPFFLEKPALPLEDAASGTMTIRVDGRFVALVPFDF